MQTQAQFLVSEAQSHHWAGRHDAAAALYRMALDSDPEQADAVQGLCQISLLRGDLAGALVRQRQVVALAPSAPAAWTNLAELRRRAQAYPQAAGDARHSLQLLPTISETWNTLGNIAFAQWQPFEAVEAFRQALALAPERHDYWYNYGSALHRARLNRPAVVAYGRAAALKPMDAAAYGGIAAVLQFDGWDDGAALACRLALTLAPATAEMWCNMAELAAIDQVDLAYRYFDRALALQPGMEPALYNRALVDLSVGNLDRGFKYYGLRRVDPFQAIFWRPFAAPTWAGEDIRGRTILIHAEQGLGDTLQFVRYVPKVAALGARVILEVQQELMTLLAGFPGVAQLVARGSDLPPVDLQVPMLDLPRLFGTDLSTIPAEVPYLTPDPDRRAKWHARLAGLPGRKVGLVWAGNPQFKSDGLRSPRLPPLLPLFEEPGISFVGLQFGDGRRDIDGVAMPANFIDLAAEIDDFADTAAALGALDLLITSCTSVVHLAGAINVPTWVMLHHRPDWRWLLDRDDSPWYPSVRLFRQRTPGDWAGVIAAIRHALKA